MADGYPKDYSGVCEDTAKPPLHPVKGGPIKIWSDGAKAIIRPEGVDLLAVVEKLQKLPKENQKAHAMDALNKHYSSVFKKSYKVYLQYFDEKETYVIRTDNNTLNTLKERIPKRGNYRYFFKQSDNTYEEIESPEELVPVHEFNGSRLIYCQLFPLSYRD